MAPDDSLIDSISSQNYQWVRDSWISQNHPTVDNTDDRSTFVRSPLDSVGKEQARRMAQYLDNYKSPDQRPLSQRQLDKTVDRSYLIPQASSSPKSVSYVRRDHISGDATPSMSVRSMSPTPTNQTTSWHKHSMRPFSAGTSSPAAALGPQLLSSSQRSEKRHDRQERRMKQDEVLDTNFRPVELCQVEDSHWNDNMKSQIMHRSEVTPSSVKYKEEFFTAKQFGIESNKSVEVESLAIATNAVEESPTLRKIVNYNEPTINSKDRRSLVEQVTTGEDTVVLDVTCESTGIVHEFPTNAGTMGNATRTLSDCGSELSRVDSQSTSLQQAISMALQSRPEIVTGTRKRDQFDVLPLEEAIAARYRQSRAERSHNTNEPQRFLGEHFRGQELVLPLDFTETASTDIPSSNPNVNVPASQCDAIKDSVRPSSAELNQSQMAEMLETLERVTEECSRRGHMIETMAETVGKPTEVDSSIADALELANRRSRELELQLLEYQSRVEQMAQELQEAKSDAPNDQHNVAEPEAQAQALYRGPLIDISNGARPSATQMSEMPAPNVEPVSAICSPIALVSEESFHDKVQRWEDKLEAVPERVSTIRQNDSIDRARQVLNRDLSFVFSLGATTKRLAKSEANNYGSLNHLVTPREAQVAESPSVISIKRGPSCSTPCEDTTRPSGLNLTHALRSAQEEIERLQRPAQGPDVSQGRVAQDVRPLTADMMPDAQDMRKCPEEKLFERLQLSRAESLGQVELANLIKNILVQLDVPYDDLISTITSLGDRLTADEASANDALVHEAIKLRNFAERVHATLYGGEHIEGAITSSRCLKNMSLRVDKMQRAIVRSRTERV